MVLYNVFIDEHMTTEHLNACSGDRAALPVWRDGFLPIASNWKGHFYVQQSVSSQIVIPNIATLL